MTFSCIQRLIRALLLSVLIPLSIPLWAATESAPSPQVFVSSSSAWGTASDTWAGYSGQIEIWTPYQISGSWTLSFVSRELGQQAAASGFWNASATYDPTQARWTITAPAWSSGIAANGSATLGFNGSGVLSTGFTLTDCTLNGVPCAAAVKTATDAQAAISALKAGTLTQTPVASTPTPVPAPDLVSTAPTSTGPLTALFSVGTTWTGGFGGQLTLKNTSSQSLPAGAQGWAVHLKFPDQATAANVFQGGPWNFVVAFGPDGAVTLTPPAWSAAVAPGSTISSGFNGGDPANLSKAVSLDAGVTLQFASSVGSASTVASATQTQAINSTFALPTGSAGGFIFSPYKDTTISQDWNTHIISTRVGGGLNPLLTVLPNRVPAVTLAFATGICGSETWGGVKPDALVAANIPLFTQQNRNYIISTGGAAGSFNCDSADGMRGFINRYASKNLIGIDFDIEAGQSAADILALVKSVHDVQAEFPGLRFSFTLATLASTNGAAATAPYGDLNVTGYNTIKALAQYPISNYTINLMVMDYGAAGAQNCVIGTSGKCDMGKSAIQAAKNLFARYGIANDRIELTPMIGQNDVVDEFFTLADADILSAWARFNGIVGLHFWSLDRDTPCPTSGASPICSSLPDVQDLGFTQRFIQALGL